MVKQLTKYNYLYIIKLYIIKIRGGWNGNLQQWISSSMYETI